jgi:hypothetical protein
MNILQLNRAFLVIALAVSFHTLANGMELLEQPGIPVPFNPVFDTSFRKGLFKATMDIGKHHMSGLVYIKKLNDSTYRMLFNNEIGMKFFDLEVSRMQFIIHSCYPSLDRKNLMSILKNDLRVLFFMSHQATMVRKEYSDSLKQERFTVKSETGTWSCYITGDKNIRSIESEGKLIRKTKISFKDQSQDNKGQIVIANPVIGLVIHLKMIGN